MSDHYLECCAKCKRHVPGAPNYFCGARNDCECHKPKHGDWVTDTRHNETFQYDGKRDRYIVERLRPATKEEISAVPNEKPDEATPRKPWAQQSTAERFESSWTQNWPRDELLKFVMTEVARAEQRGRDQAVDWIEEHSTLTDDPKTVMIIHDEARGL